MANQPNHKGGVLFVDSADKAPGSCGCATRSTSRWCSWRTSPASWSGRAVERQGIIRHGAKMITAVSEATVPKICVVVRKAYGAGLYAMAGPGFEPDATIALPTARIAVMGPEPAVNAVYYNKIQEIADPDERAAYVAERRREYEEDIDLLHLASEGVVDAVVQPDELREELVRRLAAGRDEGPRRSATAATACRRSDADGTGRVDVEGGVATVTLSRPEALNAISGEMAVEVSARSAPSPAGMRASSVLAAEGDRAFCVGADLKERSTLDHAGWLQNRELMAGMFAPSARRPCRRSRRCSASRWAAGSSWRSPAT